MDQGATSGAHEKGGKDRIDVPLERVELLDQELGKSLFIFDCSLTCVTRSQEEWLALLPRIAHALNMTCAYPPAVWPYPYGGKGGNGLTIVQAITESYISLDVWPDHRGVYLCVKSCEPFDVADLIAWLSRNVGLVLETCSRELRL
jgi:hypothetical protein